MSFVMTSKDYVSYIKIAAQKIHDNGEYISKLDGTTGEILHSVDLGFLVEASLAVFGNMLVVGTRGKLICGVQIQ